MKHTVFVHWILLIFCACLFSGCANYFKASSYDEFEAGKMQLVRYGQIVKISKILIKGETNGGAVIGGTSGGIIGSQIANNGEGSVLGAIGGAIFGGIAGRTIEKSLAHREGLNIHVRLCSGETVAVVQDKDKKNILNIGDSVSVISNSQYTRVMKEQTDQCTNIE